MNERIKELNLQAMSIVMNGNDPDGDIEQMYIPSEFTKKFAELIVLECAVIVGSMEEPHQDIAKLIKQHFGVDSTSIKVGSRVKVVSGFNVGAKGTVSYIEPTGRMWVMRDGASTDVFYTLDEVVRIEQ